MKRMLAALLALAMALTLLPVAALAEITGVSIIGGPTVTVEVNGVKYTLERMSATGNYRLVKGVFTSTGTYRIRILSIG